MVLELAIMYMHIGGIYSSTLVAKQTNLKLEKNRETTQNICDKSMTTTGGLQVKTTILVL